MSMETIETPVSEYKRRVGLLIEALDSGEFAQGRDHLKNADKNTYCCLGVACEVYRRETGVGEWTVEMKGYDPTYFTVPEDDRYARDCSSIELPLQVRDWYGFRTDTGHLADDGDLRPRIAELMGVTLNEFHKLYSGSIGGSVESLTTLNDTLRMTFSEIAALLRSYPEYLFSWYSLPEK